MTITIMIGSGIWLRAGEEAIVRRIAQVVRGDAALLQEKPSGWKWNLCPGNDWWAGRLNLDTITLSYRYGGGGNSQMMNALQVFLCWIFA